MKLSFPKDIACKMEFGKEEGEILGKEVHR